MVYRLNLFFNKHNNVYNNFNYNNTVSLEKDSWSKALKKVIKNKTTTLNNKKWAIDLKFPDSHTWDEFFWKLFIVFQWKSETNVKSKNTCIFIDTIHEHGQVNESIEFYQHSTFPSTCNCTSKILYHRPKFLPQI